MRILCIKLSWALLIYLCYSSASKIEPRATQPGQGDLCYFYRHRSAVAGEKLYFMGGFYTIEGGSTNENEQQLFRVDLSSSFAVNGILPASSVVTSPAPPNSNWKGAGAFFVDDTDTILYSYGGFERDYEPQNSMAMYNTTSQSWSTVTVSGGNLNQGDREESMYTSSLGTDLSLSFIQGGYTSAMGPSAWLESASATNLTGMITFNSSDASNLSWTNSTKFSNAPETMGAKMQFVRYGRSGVLIAFGGFNTLYNETFRAMSQIMVYDIASTTW
ncbi:MAG: hypothetical protein M1830_003110 [Pleopsidium flavum]|nr:MAG: hypothetical protein M1830_003110 [Pleopsidium flavum]